MEVTGGEDHHRIGCTVLHDARGAHPDTTQVRDIMGFIIVQPVLLQPVLVALLPAGE